ncbi:tRNA glutamyl-Q(34) synthetase GluQRS [Actibacterium lipolyticum]|uniref:Glutamate--tRNA ligase n=1 Tax=Actibacterium lipolyticum TaxID=1524263 RepID=A0A238JWF7_9RHOB|nr:tRNA glutamyl-Q(34) synthetase GluQRS [Actibacterium lipolyticum]SMX34980.1 Glutamate--tRNA ligase [Actibacterium lipolyticum]
MTYRTRFAPSPTGPLHLGHAYSALLAYDRARLHGGEFLLRIEDTDTQRCKPEWETLIYEDLHWLGLEWETPVRRQSEHLEDYDRVLDQLAARGLIYPCSCTRGDIRAALSAPQEGAPLVGPDGIVYPGTCRGRDLDSRKPGDALRLNMRKAVEAIGNTSNCGFIENGPDHTGTHQLDAETLISGTGDVVLGRKEIETVSYLLAAVWDDAAQGITEVVRGVDLYEATFVQVLLQALLDLPTPTYFHHLLIRDEDGKRLAKRHDSKAIRLFRQDGASPEDIRRMVGL